MIKKLFSVFFVFTIFLISLGNVQAQSVVPSYTPVGNISNSTGSNTCPKVYVYVNGQYKEQSITDTINKLKDVENNPANNPDTTPYVINNITYNRETLLSSFKEDYLKLACPPKLTDLQTLFLRFLVIADTAVGLALFYVFVRAGFIRMTARGNPEALKKSAMMISNGILGLLIVLGAYVGLVFLGTRLLPSDPCTRFSFVDSGRILFLFDQSDISPITDQGLSGCSTNAVLTTTPTPKPLPTSTPKP